MRRVRAIAELRFKLMMRRLQGTRGALQVAGSVLLGASGVAFALLMAGGFGFMVHAFTRSGEPKKILIGYLIVFYLALLFGILMPMMRGALDQGFDASPFVIYPVRRVRLYGITLVACLGSSDHLMYFPTMLAIAVTGVLLPGNNAPIGLGLIVACVAFLVIWGNLLSLGVVGLMRARRIREIAGVVGLTLLIALAFVPAMLDDDAFDIRITLDNPLVAGAVSVARFLPPSIAAEGLAALNRANGSASAALGLLWLLVWDAAGLGLGYLIFDRYHLGETGIKVGGRARPALAPKAEPAGWLTLDGPLFAGLPADVRAVVGKDLHYLFRSVIGRVNLFTAPLFTLLIAILIGRNLDKVIFGLDPERLVLYGMLLYGTMFSANFFNNTLAWEGDGVQSYYLGPASPQRVFLGKNLALWLYNVILLVSILTTWTIVSGPPDPLTLATGILIFATALLIFTTVGNVLSVIFPVPRDVSAMKNNPSSAAVLLSLLVLLITAAAIGSLVGLPMLLGWRSVQPVLLLALLGGLIFVYRLTLGTTARLFDERRESIIHTFKTAR